MPNPGNSGQRWSLRKLVNVEIVGGHVRYTLECGHAYDSLPHWGETPEELEELAGFGRERIGKRQRCLECKPEGTSK